MKWDACVWGLHENIQTVHTDNNLTFCFWFLHQRVINFVVNIKDKLFYPILYLCLSCFIFLEIYLVDKN